MLKFTEASYIVHGHQGLKIAFLFSTVSVEFSALVSIGRHVHVKYLVQFDPYIFECCRNTIRRGVLETIWRVPRPQLNHLHVFSVSTLEHFLALIESNENMQSESLMRTSEILMNSSTSHTIQNSTKSRQRTEIS